MLHRSCLMLPSAAVAARKLLDDARPTHDTARMLLDAAPPTPACVPLDRACCTSLPAPAVRSCTVPAAARCRHARGTPLHRACRRSLLPRPRYAAAPCQLHHSATHAAPCCPVRCTRRPRDGWSLRPRVLHHAALGVPHPAFARPCSLACCTMLLLACRIPPTLVRARCRTAPSAAAPRTPCLARTPAATWPVPAPSEAAVPGVPPGILRGAAAAHQPCRLWCTGPRSLRPLIICRVAD